MKLITSILFVLISCFIFAQKSEIITVDGHAQIEWASSVSEDHIKEQVKQLAIINAIENAFGRAIIQGNSTYIQNIQTGDKVNTTTGFNMIADSWVNGECIDVIKSDFVHLEGTKRVEGKIEKIKDIKCTVTIKARKLENNEVLFEAKTFACQNPKCATERFKNNDKLYISFKSPTNGYLSIYLDDKEFAYRLLPYQTMNESFDNGVPIIADKEYFLFSTNDEHNYFVDYNFIEDTYLLTTDNPQEMNRLFVLFSEEPFGKPFLKKSDDKEKLVEKEINQGYTIPKALPSEEFQKWLLKKRRNTKIQVKPIDIIIEKK